MSLQLQPQGLKWSELDAGTFAGQKSISFKLQSDLHM
jgi:hypothetical protein